MWVGILAKIRLNCKRKKWHISTKPWCYSKKNLDNVSLGYFQHFVLLPESERCGWKVLKFCQVKKLSVQKIIHRPCKHKMGSHVLHLPALPPQKCGWKYVCVYECACAWECVCTCVCVCVCSGGKHRKQISMKTRLSLLGFLLPGFSPFLFLCCLFSHRD